MTLPWYRWHPEVALRYIPVVEEIKRSGAQSVLDVGSGSLGIAPYLKRPVTGIDIAFEGPTVSWLRKVQGDGRRLPFADNSFDAVVAIDMLEHIVVVDREDVVSECIRVARKLCVLGVPVGEASERQDRELASYYKNRFGSPHPNFDEHLTFGLPARKDVEQWLERSLATRGKHAATRIYANESLWLHRILMKGWMTRSGFLDFFFRKGLLPMIPLLRLWNQPPAYRAIFMTSLYP